MCLLYHFLVNPSPGEGAGGRPCPWPAARRAVGSSAGTGPPRGGFVTNLLRKGGFQGLLWHGQSPAPWHRAGTHLLQPCVCALMKWEAARGRRRDGKWGKKKKGKRALSSFPSRLGQSTPSCSVVPIPAAFCHFPSSCCALHRIGVKSSFSQARCKPRTTSTEVSGVAQQ